MVKGLIMFLIFHLSTIHPFGDAGHSDVCAFKPLQALQSTDSILIVYNFATVFHSSKTDGPTVYNRRKSMAKTISNFISSLLFKYGHEYNRAEGYYYFNKI